MKKKLFSMLMVTTMFALPVFVNAEEVKPSDFNDSKDVTVGEVDSIVYSVDLEWQNLSYDWKYDRATNNFEFVAPLACQAIDATEQSMRDELQGYVESGIGVFNDDACSVAHTGSFESGNIYYAQNGIYPTLHLTDRSVNGKIKAKASFTPSGSYADWVVGKFYSYTTFNNNKVAYHDELTDGYFTSNPLTVESMDDGSVEYISDVTLKLDVDSQYTGEKVVATGNKIGTITIEISQDTD